MKFSNHIHYLFLVLLTSVYAAPRGRNFECDASQARSPPFPSFEEHPSVPMHSVVDATRILKRMESIEMTTYPPCELHIESTSHFDVSTVDKGFIERIVNEAAPRSQLLSGWATLKVPDKEEWEISNYVEPQEPIMLNVKPKDGRSGELALVLSRKHPEEHYIVFDLHTNKPLLTVGDPWARTVNE
ncbi:hypothetical protein C8R42DRAFT_662958 [Lentinula raphanica]|nr:hypothetical protein C8R42DRAFT_662958 [Lentinula raphanica]